MSAGARPSSSIEGEYKIYNTFLSIYTYDVHYTLIGGDTTYAKVGDHTEEKVEKQCLGPHDFCSVCYKETFFSSYREEIILMSLKCVKIHPSPEGMCSKGVVHT